MNSFFSVVTASKTINVHFPTFLLNYFSVPLLCRVLLKSVYIPCSIRHSLKEIS